LQASVEDDEGTPFQEQQSSHSLVELSQSSSSGLKIVESLKDDFANIFRREPHWNNFAKYFSLGDRTTGGALYGVDEAKKVVKILRRLSKSFSVKNFKVDFIEKNFVESKYLNARYQGEIQVPLDAELIAHWSVELKRKSANILEPPLLIEAQMLFRINRDSKVSFASITACFINGFQPFPMVWPEVDLEDSKNVNGISDWILALSAYTQAKDPNVEDVLGIGEWLASDESSLSSAVNTLKADFSKILRQEPHWGIFEDNLTLVDQTGTNLVGLESNQVLLDLLQKLPRKFVITNVQVTYHEMVIALSSYRDGKLIGKMQEPLAPDLRAEWKLKINTRQSWLQWKKDPPLTIQAETLFKMDEEGKFDAILVDGIYINEQFDVLQWPDVDLSEAPEISMEYIEQWIQDIQLQVANPADFEGYGDDLTPDTLRDWESWEESQGHSEEP
jgi:hypothetical protein